MNNYEIREYNINIIMLNTQYQNDQICLILRNFLNADFYHYFKKQSFVYRFEIDNVRISLFEGEKMIALKIKKNTNMATIIFPKSLS